MTRIRLAELRNASRRARARARRVARRAQGLVGAAAVVTGISFLSSWPWGLLVAGGVLLIGAAADELGGS